MQSALSILSLPRNLYSLLLADVLTAISCTVFQRVFRLRPYEWLFVPERRAVKPEHSGLLRCVAVSLGEWIPTFGRTMILHSSTDTNCPRIRQSFTLQSSAVLCESHVQQQTFRLVLFVSLPTVTGTLTDPTGHALWDPWVQFSSSFPLQCTDADEQNALVVLSLA